MADKWVPGEGKVEAKELLELDIPRVDLVEKPANLRRFTILKGDDATVLCENCGATHSAEAIRKAAEQLKGLDVTCSCGEVIKVEKEEPDDEAKKKAEEEAKKKAEEEAKKKAEEEKNSATQGILENLAKLQEENAGLKEEKKGLESQLAEKDTRIKELEEALKGIKEENGKLEELATDSIELANDAAEAFGGGETKD